MFCALRLPKLSQLPTACSMAKVRNHWSMSARASSPARKVSRFGLSAASVRAMRSVKLLAVPPTARGALPMLRAMKTGSDLPITA